MISIFYLSALYFMIFFLLQYLKLYTEAYYIRASMLGTLIFMHFNAYPFLLKTDGYILYIKNFLEFIKYDHYFLKPFFIVLE